jgi:hypothetical protein
VDILRLIEEDHQKVAELFQKLHQTRASSHNRQQVFDQLKKALELHSHAETQVFYLALQDSYVTHDMALDAEEDHRLMAEMLEELDASSKQDEAWDEKLQALQENVEEHIQEEESDLFDAARQLFSDAQAQQLAEQWQQVKQAQRTL